MDIRVVTTALPARRRKVAADSYRNSVIENNKDVGVYSLNVLVYVMTYGNRGQNTDFSISIKTYLIPSLLLGGIKRPVCPIQ